MLEKSFFDAQVMNRICEDVRRDMAKKSKENDEIEWDVDVEILFLYAMIGHKPVGVNRHFMMLLIHKKFSEYLNRDISSKVLWDHLDTMYDMAALHESEIIPFPNEEVEFELPEDFHDLIQSKYGVTLKKPSSENEVRNINSRSSKKITPKVKPNTSLQSSKNVFATPSLKPSKNQTNISESKAVSSDLNSSARQDTPLTKGKVKHASSTPSSSGKVIKSESTSVAKDEISESKRLVSENNSSAKKVIKTESSATRKSSVSSTKQVDIPDSNKKSKEKDSVQRKRESSDSHSLKKTGTRVENVSSNKKKSESDGSKKLNEVTVKQMKAEVKISPLSSKMQESLTASGSKKHKVKPEESDKKVKRVRSGSEESIKKSNSVKRKRV